MQDSSSLACAAYGVEIVRLDQTRRDVALHSIRNTRLRTRRNIISGNRLEGHRTSANCMVSDFQVSDFQTSPEYILAHTTLGFTSHDDGR